MVDKKYLIKGYKAKYYKTFAGWQNAYTKCRDAKHEGWSFDVTNLFTSRVCKDCKAQLIYEHDGKP